MESQISSDNENLTTDACPSPPRNSNNSTEASTSNFNDANKQESNTPQSQYKKKKTKPKKVSTKAVANIYNINNANGIHIGSNIIFNMVKSQKRDEPNENVVIKTKAVDNLLQNTDIVTEEVRNLVSEHIGGNWRQVIRSLDYSNGQIDQQWEKHFVSGVRETVYQILLDWYQNKPNEATVGALATALWNAQERDVVQRLINDIYNK